MEMDQRKELTLSGRSRNETPLYFPFALRFSFLHKGYCLMSRDFQFMSLQRLRINSRLQDFELATIHDCLALLHFIYWDAVPDVEELVGLNSKWVSTLMAQHLLAAADRYALERLRLLCEAKLCEDIAINTVATTLALAEQHQCLQLKAVCLKFVALPENLKAVMQTDGFEYLKESCPSVVTELLQYVAKMGEHSVIACARGNESLDGDMNGRRVKQRIH